MALGTQIGHLQFIYLYHGHARRQLGDFFIRIHAFHRRPAAALGHQLLGNADKITQLSKSAAGNHVELFAHHCLYPAGNHLHIVQAQLNRRLLQKRGFFAVGIQQRHRQIRACNRNRNTGHTAAGSDINQPARLCHIRQQGQAVEDVVADYRLLIAQGGEVIGAVPFFQQLHKGQQLQLLRHAERDAHLLQAVLQMAFQITHAVFAPSNPRFKCTINKATAAGVTPEMRAACPTVSGRCWFNFCCTSADKPFTLA